MLIASAKIPEHEGASRHADSISNCLTFSHTCLLYLRRNRVFLFVPVVAERSEHAG